MPRSGEDRWFSFGMNAVDALTESEAGEMPTYSIRAGLEGFITPEAIIDPAAATESKQRGIEHLRRTLNFDWSNMDD